MGLVVATVVTARGAVWMLTALAILVIVGAASAVAGAELPGWPGCVGMEYCALSRLGAARYAASRAVVVQSSEQRPGQEPGEPPVAERLAGALSSEQQPFSPRSAVGAALWRILSPTSSTSLVDSTW